MGAAAKSALQWEQGVQIGRDSVTELRSGCSNNNSHGSCDSRTLEPAAVFERTRRRPAQRSLSFPRSRLVTALLVGCHERFFPLSPIAARLSSAAGSGHDSRRFLLAAGSSSQCCAASLGRAAFDGAAGNSPFLVSVPRTPVAVPVRRRLRLV